MSQSDMILEVLQRGEAITPFSGFALCGSLAVHSRIAELRARGYQIECRMVTRGGKKFGEYRLASGQLEMFRERERPSAH